MAIDIEAPSTNKAELMAALSDLKKHRGCRLERTTSLTAQNYTAGTTDLVFQVATLDSDGFWSAGTPGRATVPSSKGFKVANVSASFRTDLTTIDTYGQISLQHYNASNVLQRFVGMSSEVGGTTRYLEAHMLCVPLADGDYFVVRPVEESDNSVTINAACAALCVDITGMDVA